MHQLLPTIYAAAVLLPLLSFVGILLMAKGLGRYAAWMATSAILGAGVLSFLALGLWLSHHFLTAAAHHAEHEAHDAQHEHAAAVRGHGEATTPAPATAGHAESHADAEHEAKPVYTGEYYTLGSFGPLRVTISYYIDALTVVMFCMVTFIATCIHFYAIGYMHDELHNVTDKEVTLANGEVLHRPGRFPRFFQYLSLFCFSMLGLVIAGNIAMVFVFWELVGICSYFLIGFYVERKSASTAANKAFIVNRVGDFGMIIGLLVIWSTLGTFAFGDIERTDADGQRIVETGIFSRVRPGPSHALIVPDEMVLADAHDEVANIVKDHASGDSDLASAKSEADSRMGQWREKGYGYWLLVLAGLGIFCGCVGKSAQFPLHVWLPDAMEGPTPVSALVHSATMVAAGVYLVGRFYPVFTPEVLLVIAIVGTITMLLAASIAFAANDIKRVLAYSTVSQLGLMMLALGVGGWLAGLLHLVTHAFFKSLLFMCSGSVIHAVHTNDMRKMGGLFRKMPVTAITMLIGCLAIAGVAVPFVIGFAGHYSKDAILEQALSFWQTNGGNRPAAGIFFVFALMGAALTTCYMFRMWFMTFVGAPRDRQAYEHAHESPPVMVLPLVVLAVMATVVAWNFTLIGFGLIAAAFFVVRGVQLGWFKRPAAAHGHEDHADADAHEHGHAAQEHGHGTHAQVDHAQAMHDHHDEHAEPPVTWAWVGTMLAASVIGGLLIQHLILPRVLSPNAPIYGLTLGGLLEQARPEGTLADARGNWVPWTWPNEHAAHEPSQFARIVAPATLLATGSWVGGIFLAAAFFWWGYLNPSDVRRQFAPIYNLLVNKWWFDELYDFLFVQPTLVISRLIANFDKRVIDWFLDGTATATVWFSRAWDLIADRGIVDGSVNLFAGWMYSLGLSLRSVQTGQIRQYVMFIVIGAIAIFVLISFFWSPTPTLAG